MLLLRDRNQDALNMFKERVSSTVSWLLSHIHKSTQYNTIQVGHTATIKGDTAGGTRGNAIPGYIPRAQAVLFRIPEATPVVCHSS